LLIVRLLPAHFETATGLLFERESLVQSRPDRRRATSIIVPRVVAFMDAEIGLMTSRMLAEPLCGISIERIPLARSWLVRKMLRDIAGEERRRPARARSAHPRFNPRWPCMGDEPSPRHHLILIKEGNTTMADTGTLHDAFIDELRDAYDAEKQLTNALAKLAKTASNPKLRDAFESHLEETHGHVARLEQVFESLDEKVRGKHCDGIAGIIKEGKSTMGEDFDDAVMDACLIAAGQRAEHYEMAAYGTLIAWARGLGHDDAVTLLQQTLDEEKAADKKLSGLAEGGINQTAADSAHADEDEEEEDEPAEAGASAGRKASATAKGGRR
jgi:ferritin-like metal-binding protein YciE